jgi:DNA-binding NtrC family response regulator
MPKPWTILIVDDDPDSLRLLARYLENPEYRVLTSHGAAEALVVLESEDVHLVVTDLMMPGIDGMALTREVKQTYTDIPVIMATAFGSVQTAVEAMRAGASDYITKPVDPAELAIKAAKALEQVRLRAEVARLKKEVSRGSRASALFLGVSPRMRKVFDLVELLAQRDVPVIIEGESGTGKEVVARAIHEMSSRASRPFVPLNCGALPESLLESELFGYEKGAFTGAASQKKGLFEEAHGGTLFLDEVGDAPMSIQIKLLRALQEGEIRRLGSTQQVTVNVRILTATNKPIHEEIAGGRFREDLYYRLAVVTIDLPPLRDRKEDIPVLADTFLARHRDAINPVVEGITPQAREALMAYDWPGNIRELENIIRRGLVMCRTQWLTERELTLPASGKGRARVDHAIVIGEPLVAAERRFLTDYFTHLLRRHGGKVQAAAAEADISRKNVYDHLKRLKMDPAVFRRSASE